MWDSITGEATGAVFSSGLASGCLLITLKQGLVGKKYDKYHNAWVCLRRCTVRIFSHLDKLPIRYDVFFQVFEKQIQEEQKIPHG